MAHHGHKRDSAISSTMSLYLGELYRLGGHHTKISTSALAGVLDVTPAAVARMVSRLEALGLVAREPYHGVRLTPSGQREALRIIRYHRLAEAFLVRVLKYEWHEAHDMADAIADVADETFIDRIDEAAGFPRRCPHGEPIPSRDGIMPEVSDVPLNELAVGQSGKVSRVRTRDEDRLQYFAEVGMVPEARLRVQGRGPFQGPLRLELDGTEFVLGTELAREVLIEVDG